MACTIKIKKALETKVEQLTDNIFNLTLEEAQKVSSDVNELFKDNVVTVTQSEDKIERNIEIPESLVNIYYNNEVQTDKLQSLEGSTFEKLQYFEEDNQSFNNSEEIDYEKENKYIFFGNENPNKLSVDDILINISQNYNDLTKESLDLFKKATNLFNKHKVGIKYRNSLDNPKAVMGYSISDNSIVIPITSFNNYTPEQMIKSFLHELTHAQTVKALLNPETFEEKEFKKLINESFIKYKDKSLLSGSYGFTDELEFVAEIYSNDNFRNEIKELNKSFWKDLINSIRRLFGLTPSSNQLFDQIISFVESDHSEFNGIENDLIINSLPEKIGKTKIESVEDRLTRTLNKAKDNLDQMLKRSKTYKKTNPEKGARFEQHIQELISEIEKVDNINQWKGIAVYVKSMNNTVTQLSQRLNSEDLTKGNGLEIIELYKSYLSSYDLIDDVRKLVSSLDEDKIKEIGVEDILTIKNDITEASGKHAVLESDFNGKLSKILESELSDIKYTPQVATDWKNKLGKEFKARGITYISQTEWVAQQMNTVYKDAIQNDIDAYIRNLISGIGSDISMAAVNFLDGINNNSRLVQVTMQLFTETRNNIITRTRESDFKLKELFTKLTKEKGESATVSKLYENIIEKDSTGKVYIKGTYSIKFREETKRLQDLRDSLLKEKGKDNKEYQEARDNYKKWMKENTLKDLKGIRPTKKWLNDTSGMSKVEKEILVEFVNILNTTATETLGRNSLVKTYKGATYYNLPSITNSYLERVTEGNTKGIFKDIKEDLFKIRPDDIGFEERKLDSKGDPVNFLKVHYRGELSPDQQSLDLFTVMRLERINGINFSEKQKIQLTVEAIKTASKNKEYLQTQKGSNVPILNLFANRDKTVTMTGDRSNEYKMISNLIEKNLYDIFHVNYGTLAGADVNKVISTANAWTATVGLSLNRFSAAANLLNGQAQIFLEKVAGNHITKGAVTKAHKIYNSDLSNIMSDYGKPIKESFVNQVNQMFDTFGGFTVKQQEFIKNTIAKTSADFGSLQFMHEGGEHYMQSIMTMAALDSIKVMNSDNQYIDKEGNIVEQSKAASILDMLAKDESGFLKLNDKVIYSDKNLTTKFNEGGQAQILLFVKKKLFDTMGNYDSNLQPEAYRHWWGKIMMMFRRYLIPQAYVRYRGIASAGRKYEDLDEDKQYYSAALQDYEEGYYVSTIRFLRHGMLPALKQLKYDILRQNWNDLTDTQKSNIKKSIVELSLTAAILPLLTMLAVAGAGDDDDSVFWTVAFLSRRLESELSQFRDPREATKITKSPIPSLRIIEDTMDVIESTLTPWNWDEEYESGKRKGDLKIIRNYEKLVPVLSRIDTTAEELYTGINSSWGK